jgi:hypothetical protein
MAKKKNSPFIDFINRLTTISSMLMLIIAILVTLWISWIIISVYVFSMDNNWAGLSMDHWIIVGIGLITLFIIITLIQNLIPFFIARKKDKEAHKPTFYQGKRVYEFTFPIESKGGIYSRTYISIDDKNLVNFRYQMILPDDLWKKKTL